VFHEEILTAEDAGESGGKKLTAEDAKDAEKMATAFSKSGI